MKKLTVKLSLSHHHADELLVVNVTVTIDVSLTDHLIDLFVGQLLTKICHDVTQLGRRDQPVAITIEDFEGLDQLLLSVRILHLAGHEGEELREINIGGGFEYWYDQQFAFRTGYFYENYTKGNRQFITLGAGLKYQVLTIDMSYLISTTQQNPLANTLRFTMRFAVGAGGSNDEEPNE